MTKDEYQRFEILPDLVIKLKPLDSDDVDELLDLFDHMGPESRYNRFHTPLNHPSEEFVRERAEILADVPPDVGEAWLLLTDLPEGKDTVIGGGRYIFVGEDEHRSAEVSVAIRDDMQGKGIGTHMLRFLAEEAKENGVVRLIATIVSANMGAVRILERLPYPVSFTLIGSEYEVEVDLTRTKIRG